MIQVLYPGSKLQAGSIITAAIKRSCGFSQVISKPFSYLKHWLDLPVKSCFVFIDPPEEWSEDIIHILNNGLAKIILLGIIPSSLADYLEVTLSPISDDLINATNCEPAPTYSYSESRACINYVAPIAKVKSPILRRPFKRFDFTDEWNNLGFGAISADNSIWSISQNAIVPMDAKVANISIDSNEVSAYAAMWDLPKASLFWFNRSVGPVDSQEWRLIEIFIANHRSAELPCWPVLLEIPYGYSAAVTMRLDCDEDVESARELWNVYQNMQIPFSLALHSAVLPDVKHHKLAKEVLAHGGSILSHTATHAPDWGGSYDAAFKEGLDSKISILAATNQLVRYAVSPFHQTPDYARTALADAGYEGCIGGIIKNDPDFLMARAGAPPGSSDGFIGHSQQCMLHGDCMLQGEDPLKIFKQAFDYAMAGRALFGYLDHPFSERYQYGWNNEEDRIQMHQKFVDYMKNSDNILFLNEDDALDFIRYKSLISIINDGEKFQVSTSFTNKSKFTLGVEYEGTLHNLIHNRLIL